MSRQSGIMTDANTLVFERRIALDRDAVWRWIIDPERRAKWLAGGTWELHPGGHLEFVFRNGDLCQPGDTMPAKYAGYPEEVQLTGEMISIDRPRLVEFFMSEPDGARSRVRIELHAAGHETLLRLTQFSLASLPRATGIAAGWHTHLDVFSAASAGKTPPSFWQRFRELEKAYESTGPAAA